MKNLTWSMAGFFAVFSTSTFAACDSGMRQIENVAFEGDVACLPAAPERIAFAEDEVVTAYLLGTPMVINNYSLNAFLDAYPGGRDARVAEMTDIGYVGELDIELFSVAEPDLIISNNWFPDENKLLAEIAPVVVFQGEDGVLGWRDYARVIATVVDREAEFDADLAALDARIADFKGRLPEGETTFSIVMYDEGGSLYTWNEASFAGELLINAGLTLAPGVLDSAAAAKVGYPSAYTLSQERIGDINADYIFLLPTWEPEDIAASFYDGPVWNSLTAVQEGRVITASIQGGPHFTRPNTAFAHRVLDEAYRGILGMSPTEGSHPNPYADWIDAN